MLLPPIVGALSDRIGRRPILIGFGVLGTLGAVSLLTALEQTRTVAGAITLPMFALLAVSGYTNAITVSLFGGTAEYLAWWFKRMRHERWFYWYVTACIASPLIVYVTIRETSRSGHMHPDTAT